MIIVIGIFSGAVYIASILIISDWDSHPKRCVVVSNSLVNVYICSQVILYYILASLLMIIFGLRTISNIRQQSTRVISLPVRMQRRRTERSL
jgi:hypothetical protein